MRPPTAGEAAAAALAAPLAAWAGFVAAPALDGGGSLASLIAAFSDPFSTKPTAGGARWALLFLVWLTVDWLTRFAPLATLVTAILGCVPAAAHPAQPAPRRGARQRPVG